MNLYGGIRIDPSRIDIGWDQPIGALRVKYGVQAYFPPA